MYRQAPKRKIVASSPAVMERRRALRILSRDLKILYDGCSDWIDVRSPDLSVEGMFINTPHEFAVGARLKLRFHLVIAGITAQAEGEVRYCLPGIGVGVEFVNLPEFARTAIKKELAILEGNSR